MANGTLALSPTRLASELERGLAGVRWAFCHKRWHTATAHKRKISGLAYNCKLAR